MQTIYLDISNKSVVPTIYAKQRDVGHKFVVELYENGVPYAIDDKNTFSIWYSGTSGDGHYDKIGNKSAFSVQNNIVTVELILQMLINSGEHLMCLVMNDASGNQLGLWNIPYYVEALPGANSEPATKYFENLEAAQEAADRAENAAKSVESLKPLHVEVGIDGKTNYNAEDIFSRASNGGDVYFTPYGSQELISLSECGQLDATFVSTTPEGVVTTYIVYRDGSVSQQSAAISTPADLEEAMQPQIVRFDLEEATMDAEDICARALEGKNVYLEAEGRYIPLTYATQGWAYFSSIREDGIPEVYRIDNEPLVKKYIGSALVVSRKNDGTEASHSSEQIASHADRGGAVYFWDTNLGVYIPLSYHTQDEATFVHIGDNGIVTAYAIDQGGQVSGWMLNLNNSGGGAVAPVVVELLEGGTKADYTSTEIKNYISQGRLVFLNSGGNHLIPFNYTDENYVSFRAATDDDGSSIEYQIYKDGSVDIYNASYMPVWTEADRAKFVQEVIDALPVYNGEVL